MKKWRILKLFVICIIPAYFIIILFPQFLFSGKYQYKNFTVYYHSGKTSELYLRAILDRSDSLLQATNLVGEKFNQNIYLCNSFGEYAFFAPLSSKAFGCNYPFIQNIFLSKSDVNTDNCERNAGEYNKRSLSGVIAHETTHTLLENKLGIIKYKLLPSWKNEGYCDFIAKESSYKQDGITEICNGINPASPSFFYFKARFYTAYLLVDEHIGLDEFLSKKFDVEELDNKLRIKYCH